MDDPRWHKYYRSSGLNLKTLIYRFLVSDSNLRRFFHFNPHCGIITFIVCLLTLVLVVCSIVVSLDFLVNFNNNSIDHKSQSFKVMSDNRQVFDELKNDAKKKLPRRRSVMELKSLYECIERHIRQTGIFQSKMKEQLDMNLLNVKIMDDKMSCFHQLLEPQTQSEWRQSRSLRTYHRPLEVESNKND